MLKLITKSLIVLCIIPIIYSTPVQDTDGVCSDHSSSNLCVKLGSKHYLIDGTSQLNWFEADRFCRRQGAFLVNIESANELSLISKYLFSKNYDLGEHWFWTSGNDLGSEGTFYSITTGQNLPFESWSNGQPDNAGGNENCVHLWKSQNGFGMNDVNCDRRIHFICELTSLDSPIFDVRHEWIKSIQS